MSYALVQELGKGGMGVVWRARDDETGQVVALKLLRDAYVDDQDYRQRFEHEMEIARRIDSPHVVKVLGYGVREDVPYIAFELVDGPSLRQLLTKHGPYSWPETRALVLQLAEGLADAHATGVVHRDVKPSNVLVGRDGTAKLADFGISRAVDLTRVTRASGFMGTPTYLAPEGPVDARSDLYSLGVVAFEVLTGNPPFEGATYHEVLAAHLREAPNLSAVPNEARPMLAWLLAKEPLARPQSARQLIRALLGEEPIPDIDLAPTIVMGPRPATGSGQVTSPSQASATGSEAEVRDADFDWSKVSFGAQRKNAVAAPAVVSASVPDPSAAPSSDTASSAPAPPVFRPFPGPVGRRNSPNVRLVGGGVAVVVVVALVGAFAILGSGGHAPAERPSPSNAPTIAQARSGSPVASERATAAITPAASPSASLGSRATPIPLLARWVGIGSLPETAFGDTASLLSNGKVVVFSTTLGTSHTSTGRSWLLDPRTGQVTAGPAMKAIQSTPSVTTLSDGSIIAVGGWDAKANPVAGVEVLDAAGNAWSALAPMNMPRSQATVTDLGGGRILVAGGWIQKNGSDSWTATDTAEIYDKNTGTWTMTGSMTTARALATATPIGTGRVLVTGGDSAWPSTEGQAVLGTTEVYDVATGTWSYAGVMSSPRAAHFAVALPNGSVLVAGGWADGRELGLASADEYDPAAAGWRRVADMPGAHAQGRGLSLPDGRVMILGGFDAGSAATATVEVFDPSTSAWTRLASLQQAVYWPCAVSLGDGRVIVAGGWTDKAPTHAIEVFDPSGQ